MEKFNSIWNEERVKDLLTVHKGRSHSETASELTNLWGVFISRDAVKNKYNSLIQFGEPTENRTPGIVKNREYFDKTDSDEGKSGQRVYFITSAIAGCNLEKNFFKSIETFCKSRKAKLVVLPMRGAERKDEEFNEEVLEQLSDHFYTDYIFNSNIQALDLCISPTQVNPLTGIQRVSKKSSIIISSPKQSMEVIPVSNSNLPHILHSTGSITSPAYNFNRVGMLAIEDHIVGGLILEVENNNIFHLRQVQADRTGTFYDLDKKYTPKEVVSAKTEAVVLGDIHAGSEDQGAIKAFKEVIRATRPKYIVLHDLFDSRSVSYHEEDNIYARITRPPVYQFLKTELDNLVKTVDSWSKEFPESKFVVVASNHNEHLEKYLDSGRFVEDIHNYRIALDLAIWRADGYNVLEKYIESKLGNVKNFIWLKRDQDFKVSGVQLSVHGDVGANGARGTATGIEKSYVDSISGHSHSPRILRSAWVVGTCTKLKLSYTQGPSSWLHTSALLYENAQRQLINSLDGKWKI